VQHDRIAAAREMARRFRASVVLKGCGSVLALPDGRWFINTSGHPGMATAGMGDVLTGLIASLLAQGWPAEPALVAAVHMHGAAADRLAREGIGPIGLTAGEVAEASRGVFNGWVVQANSAHGNGHHGGHHGSHH
jgi:NAD(P)H-hydrate repair Nnr-like enzyme with NAD(P)H-hydrate dehydratase domain